MLRSLASGLAIEFADDRVYLGRDEDGRPIQAVIDEIRIYDRALDDEMKVLFDNP